MYIYIICLLAYSLCIHNIYYVYCVWNYTKYCLCDHSMCWQDMQFLIVSTLCCSLIPGIWYLLQCHAIIFSCVCVFVLAGVCEECKRTHTHIRADLMFAFVSVLSFLQRMCRSLFVPCSACIAFGLPPSVHAHVTLSLHDTTWILNVNVWKVLERANQK